MDLQSLSISLTIPAMICLVAILVAVFVWLLIRKKRMRSWVPTLRLIELETSQLPKLKFVKPPILAFLCFLLCVASLLFFTMKPTQKVYRDVEPGQVRTHVFLDLSPSVSYMLPIEQYRQKVSALLDDYIQVNSFSINASGKFPIQSIGSSEALQEYLESIDYHRAGVKLGQAVHRSLEQVGKIDRLIVVSDRDRSSWNDFNWQFLQSKFDVFFAPVRENSDTVENFFVEKIQLVSSSDEASFRWEVILARNEAGPERDIQLVASTFDKELARKVLHFPSGVRELQDNFEIYRSKLQGLGIQAEENVPVVWQLELVERAQLNTQNDGIAMDNTFRSYLTELKQDVLVISEPQGEQFLEDPIHHLSIALELVGFQLRRMDRVPADQQSLYQYPFWVLSGGARGSYQDFCPSSLIKRRLAQQSTMEGARGAQPLPKVWLLPLSLSADYQSLCQCFATFVERDASVGRKMPLYCEDVETRDQYVSVMRSLGARQVGGQVDDILQAIAWSYQDKQTGLEVLSFTLPLQPRFNTGLSYTSLPIMVRTLLEWQGLLASGNEQSQGDWVRLSDITALKGVDASDLAASNVPIAESVAQQLNDESMPKIWSNQSDQSRQAKFALEQDDDPRLWIYLCLLLILLTVVIEVVGVFGSRLWHLTKKARANTLVVFLLLFFGGSPDLSASVKVNLFGYDNRLESLQTLARDVASRTSIELDREPKNSREIGEELLVEGWIWAANPGLVTESNGQLKPEILAWLKRGGMLIIENVSQAESIKVNSLREYVDDGWKAIPPDHEIMRSFHLLDSLPKCRESVWHGYHFDGRVAVITLPFSLLDQLAARPVPINCPDSVDRERATRIFINLLMVALATDYKKDQIHLPEILKRLR